MKKYKLIKEYPGSPKLGTEIKYAGNGWRCHKTDFALFENPDKFPEFWEKIVEKDFEILSFIGNSKTPQKGIAYKSNVNGLFTMGSADFMGSSTEELMIKVNYDIHSIKRLSDGEVFTVGDNTNEGIIKDFQLCKDSRIIISFINGLIRFLDAKGSTHVLKVKKPLFKTEDGVDIYDGDTYFKLILTFGRFSSKTIHKEKGDSNCCYGYSDKNHRKALNNNGTYYFSTREAAEEFALMNKPCLSIAEIAPVIGMCNNGKTIDLDLLTEKLKAIVEEKM